MVRLSLLSLLPLLIPGAATSTAPPWRVAPPAQGVARSAPDARPTPPTELFDVVKVVDGDTIHIQRKGEIVKLRLLSVDTEEKLSGRPPSGGSKPETLYGQECAEWAQVFFADLAEEEATPQVGLAFPGGKENLDVYGRLLCHVLLPDGTDFNVLLVETGRSPYFNKYGNSLISHGAFVEAQKRAQEKKLGVWNPATNTPKTEGAPSVKRPYDQLLPWWDARAKAIDGFRQRSAKAPDAHVAADDAAGLAHALAACEADKDHVVEIFGEIDRFFDEDDGSWTVLFRTGKKKNAFRAIVPKDARKTLASLDLPGRNEEFRQNFLSVTGHLVRGPRGYRIVTADARMWSVAGPEPEE